MLLRCCLIHISIIILRNFLCLVNLNPCLGLGLFMAHLCDLYFIFFFIFFKINHNNVIKTNTLVFAHVLEMSYYFWMITWMKKGNNFQIAKVQPQSVAQFFNHLLNFLPVSVWCGLRTKWLWLRVPLQSYKSVAYKKIVYSWIIKN